ncbi:MAG: SRPBCC family protein [Planctomycetes bacterium]|nr:SRPBCC family protein [Planctomycetota bacterium]
MKIHLLQREQWLPAPIEQVFAFFGAAANLEKITPPWLRFRILPPPVDDMQAGTLIHYRLSLHWVPIRWVTEINEWRPPFRFVDVQKRGPYALWEHTHEFEQERGGTRMRDCVRYALPLGWLGTVVHGLFVRRDLNAIFDYRARQVQAIFSR